MRSWRIFAALPWLTAGLSLASCVITESKPPLAGQRGAIKKTDSLVYLGVDFTHARFSDPNFKFEDLVHGKIPSWSRHAPWAATDNAQESSTGVYQSQLPGRISRHFCSS